MLRATSFGLASTWGWHGSYGERLRICLRDVFWPVIISAQTCVILRLIFRSGGQVSVSYYNFRLRLGNGGYFEKVIGLL